MPKIGGRQVEVGLAIESTPGTASTPTIFPKWSDFSLQAISEKELFNSARGTRNESSNSYIRRKYSQGSLGAVANIEIAPYLFGLALGSVSTADSGDSSGTINEHTITVQNNHASMKTATFEAKRGSIVEEQFTNVVCDTLNFEVSDNYANLTAELIGQFPSTGGSLSPSYTQETEFAYKDMSAKFGTDISDAEGNSATKLKGFTLNIANNVQLDEAFLSGDNNIADGGLVAGNLVITGSYTLHFEDEIELDKYKDGTKEALVVSLEGDTIGDLEKEEIEIKLAKLVLTSPPIENNIDGIVTLTQEFTVEFDSSDNEIEVVITNDQDGNDY